MCRRDVDDFVTLCAGRRDARRMERERLPVAVFGGGVAVHALGSAFFADVVSGIGAAVAIGVLGWWVLARGRSGPWVAMLAVLACAAVLVLSWELYAFAGLALATTAALQAFPRRGPAHHRRAVIGFVALVLAPTALEAATSGADGAVDEIVSGVAAGSLVPVFTAVALAVAVAEAGSRVPRRPAMAGLVFFVLYGLFGAVVTAMAAVPSPAPGDGELAAVMVMSAGYFSWPAAVGAVLQLIAVASIVTVGAQKDPPAGR
jgi:hypothetical protein